MGQTNFDDDKFHVSSLLEGDYSYNLINGKRHYMVKGRIVVLPDKDWYTAKEYRKWFYG